MSIGNYNCLDSWINVVARSFNCAQDRFIVQNILKFKANMRHKWRNYKLPPKIEQLQKITGAAMPDNC